MITLFFILAVIGVGLFFIGKIPMDATLLQIIRALGIIIAVALVLSWLFPGFMPQQMRRWQ